MSDQPSITTTSGGVNINGDTANIGGDVVGRDKIVQITQAAPTPTLRATPPRPPDHFTGREADLEKFTRLLTEGKNVAITALHGLGGIGKTSLAQKLAEQLGLGDREGRPYFPGGVLWWTLGPNPDVIPALDVWARHADPHADLTALPTAEARAEAVRPMLAKLGKMCVIIDDVWDAPSFNVLKSAVPAGCPLLMTTRDADLAKTLRCRVERIDALSDDEAVDLLVNLLGPLDGNADAACDIAHLTGGLPLALELIAGLADSPDDLPALAQRLKDKSPLDVLKRGTTREQSIETCFTLSYEHLDTELQWRFAALGVFALAPFGRDAIAAVWDEEDDAVDQSISQLVRRSLLSKVDGAAVYRQHALLHDYALKLLKAENYPHPNPPPSNKSSSTVEGTSAPSPVRGSSSTDESATSDQRTGEGREGGFLFHARHADYYRTFAKTQDWRAIEHAFDQIEHGWQWVQQHAPERIIEYVSTIRDFLENRGRQIERLNLLNAGLAQARKAKDRANEGTLLNDIGRVYKDVGEPSQALDYFQQSSAVYRELGNRNFEATTLNNIGSVYADLGQKDKALGTFQQALAIWRNAKHGDRSGEGTTLNNIGSIYADLGQKDKALDIYQQALAISREVDNRSGEGTTLSSIGSIYADLGQKDKALDIFQQALAISREVGNRSGEGTTLSSIGSIYADLDQKDKALDFYRQALAIKREVGDRSGQGTNLNNIGEVCRTSGQLQEALDTFQQVLIINREIGLRAHEAGTLNNIGLIYDARGQMDEALDTYQQALAISREVGDRPGEGTTLNNISMVYYALGQYEKAIEYFDQTATIVREVGDRWHEPTLLGNIGMLLNAMGRTTEAVTYLEQCVAQMTELGHPNLEANRAELERVRAKLATS